MRARIATHRPSGRFACFRGPTDRPKERFSLSSPDRSCLVIDAQPTLRLGIRGLLSERYAVEEASDWQRGLEILDAVGQFDVAILDMHRGDGDEAEPWTAAIRALRRAQPALGIVAHGRVPERHAARAALAAGATAFVAKSSPPSELERAVDSAAGDETFVDPAAKSGRGGQLTRRQRQILQLYADGLTTARIAHQLGLSTETIRTHTKALLARLGARDRAHAVAVGLRSGLIE
jgi:DNA-binding NarL/FixJ family response regulator